jgi:hypothetical protein
MTVHYHGTPITPLAALTQLAGKSFCVYTLEQVIEVTMRAFGYSRERAIREVARAIESGALTTMEVQ